MNVNNVISGIPKQERFHLCDVTGRILYKGTYEELKQNQSLWSNSKDKEIQVLTTAYDSEIDKYVIVIAF